MKTGTTLLWLLAGGLLATGCGTAADNNYQGDPLFTVQGQLNIEPTQRPNQTLQLALIWNVESRVDFKVDQEIDIGVQGLGSYTIDMLVPPPDTALNTDPETGGRLGFASLFAYDDPRGEGAIDLSKLSPSEYSSLIYRWRGGAENIMLAYAKDSFGEGSRIARELGGPVQPGFHLIGFEGDCYCHPVPDGLCRDSQGNGCARNILKVQAADTPVDLNIVDDLAHFKMVHSPDWLFF